jgi:hypothetical protein
VALFCTGTALIVGVFAWTALLPMGDPVVRGVSVTSLP